MPKVANRYLFMTSVTQPILMKGGELFLISDSGGEIASSPEEGLGLFYRDTRYLSRYEIRAGGQKPMVLMAASPAADRAVIELSNEEFELPEETVPRQRFGLRWEKDLNGADLILRERIIIRAYTCERARLSLQMTLDARFEDIFELRGAKPARRGELHRAECSARSIRFLYAGADGIERRLDVDFDRAPDFDVAKDGAAYATFNLDFEPQQIHELAITLNVAEIGRKAGSAINPVKRRPNALASGLPFTDVRIESDDPHLDRVLEQSFHDLRLLLTQFDAQYIAAGLPWFATVFGRDSAITALQILPFSPELAADIVRQLAARQGRQRNNVTGEEPGKIPHELRFGEMANLKEIEQQPSYWSVDATPLFLILVWEHARWTGNFELLQELREPFDAALAWLSRALDQGSGHLTYDGRIGKTPKNQSWKDSPDGVLRHDGSLPDPPLALCEVQGYAFAALRAAAELLRGAGDPEAADSAFERAQSLQAGFNRDFWMEDEGCFCIALEAKRRQVRSVTSNAGQVLWSGIADPDKGARTCQRLAQSDLWSGWGIRTLSDRSPGYNPIHYHRGSIWPFDNSLILAGLRAYGRDDLARALFADTLDLAMNFAGGRLPEFVTGLAREQGLFPARCPMADPLQAWSSGSIPYMLTALLGLQPNRLAGNEILLVRPALPRTVSSLRIRGLRIGERTVELSIATNQAGGLEVEASGIDVRMT